jgi:hypothetical protein
MSRRFRAPNTGGEKTALLPSNPNDTGHRRRHYEHLRQTGRTHADEQFVAFADAEIETALGCSQAKPTPTRTNCDGEARHE